MRSFLALLIAMLVLSAGCADWPVRFFGANLRTVDWNKTINDDPNFTYAPMPSVSGIQGRFIESKDGTLSGFAQPQQVSFGDISGDGRDEAFVPLRRDGPAGTTGLLVYRTSDRGPLLAGTISGTMLSYEPKNGALTVLSASRAGWEDGCCPSGLLERTYRVENGALKLLDERITPRDRARLPTVLRYYKLVGERKLDEAYALLSPTYQQANPRQSWETETRRTELIQITARDQNDGAVAVDVSETETNSPTTRRATVVWTLVWSAEQRQWLLDRAEVRPVS
ncbi:MAG: hypothetical protein U0556_01100 [Dehalococcoidia bacterium]